MPLLDPHKRFVVIHEDDVGMTHGANTAFAEISALGNCTSGSVMVPCPWFTEAARRFGGDPAFDLGIHLTLTSEAKEYRWRPLSGTSKGGLTDADGYFWADVPSVRRNADPQAVEAELRLQIDQALTSGIDATHLDAHMGTALCPEFVEIYGRLGRDYRLPVLLINDYMRYSPVAYSGPIGSTESYERGLAEARADGMPIFDAVLETPWERKTPPAEAYRAMFAGIEPGLTFLSLHFNAPGDFEAIVPEEAFIRTDEHALFKTQIIAEWIREFDLTPIGFRAIRDGMRAAGPS